MRSCARDVGSCARDVGSNTWKWTYVSCTWTHCAFPLICQEVDKINILFSWELLNYLAPVVKYVSPPLCHIYFIVAGNNDQVFVFKIWRSHPVWKVKEIMVSLSLSTQMFSKILCFSIEAKVQICCCQLLCTLYILLPIYHLIPYHMPILFERAI